MSTNTQNKAPMSTEPVVAPEGWKLVPIEPTDAMLLAGHSDVHNTEIWWSLMLDAAPAALVATPAPAFSVGVRGVGIIDDNPSALAVYFNAAPSDDDIRALHEIVSGTPVAAKSQPSGDRAMLESLMQSFDVEMWNCPNCTATEETKDCDSAIMLREYLANNPVSAQAQQTVSGADGLPQGWRMVPEKIPMKGLDDAIAWMRPAMNQAGRDLAYCLTGAWSILLDSVAPPDHLPDATKKVGQDQFRDAAQMIEPSGNSGEFKADDQMGFVLAAIQHYGNQKWAEGKGLAPTDLLNVREAWDAVYQRVQALTQQDADKVDAERYRWLRDPEKQSRDDDVISWVACRTLDDLDAAIDAARKGQA